MLSGGFEDVLGGGTASGTVISSGTLKIASGTASGTVISSGTLKIASGGSANLVTFSGGGTLLVDDAVQFGGLVAGFNVPADKLDPLDIPFISGTTTSNWTQLTSGANASGTLTISDGNVCDQRPTSRLIGGQIRRGQTSSLSPVTVGECSLVRANSLLRQNKFPGCFVREFLAKPLK